MATIGVCEDDPAIRKVLVRGLREAGHETVVAHDGREALTLLGADCPLEALVMDIGLPDADGRDVVTALKAAGQHAPVLFLTALGGTHDLLSGFAAGADDYLVKPFGLAELLARLDVLVRRGTGGRAVVGGLTLDAVAHAVRTEAGQVLLSPTEFRMLAAILSRPGEVVRRRTVVAAAWPDGAEVSENTIDSFLRKIRAKLESVGSPVRIETVRGVGFTAREQGAVA
ncbi:response regulator transcription factor [Nocardioides bruguierae]|uniref:Response regulator transcription factor n=1 Tax=Nocardioides bruguierae TaxID=2945102 RepID=A0A9X2D4N8_9ACTN|nr:response regulator transcription factor [Nocardioides bruguierae]MCL8024882.1 response regulator transcription factor [Nocardioides bruguierae]MCM0619286.1 response regulator transcription factor [Nocardioides bruguierae]